MEPLLDNLTLAPAAQLFELDPPHYTSSYGRRTEAIFKHNVPPAPMLISPDNGLILYERVISTKAEHQLLDKLTKPKYYHPTPNIKKGGRGGGGFGGAHTAASCSASSSSSPAPHCKSAERRPSSGSAHAPSQSSAGPADSARPSSRAGASAAGASAAPAAGMVHDGRRAGQELGQHRTRSFSAGRAAAGAGNHVRRKPLYPEDGPLKDYFSKERASVTATTVFTWGNRYKIGDCGAGRTGIGGAGGGGGRGWGGSGGSETDRASFSSYTPMQQKPPLRL